VIDFLSVCFLFVFVAFSGEGFCVDLFTRLDDFFLLAAMDLFFGEMVFLKKDQCIRVSKNPRDVECQRLVGTDIVSGGLEDPFDPEGLHVQEGELPVQLEGYFDLCLPGKFIFIFLFKVQPSIGTFFREYFPDERTLSGCFEMKDIREVESIEPRIAQIGGAESDEFILRIPYSGEEQYIPESFGVGDDDVERVDVPNIRRILVIFPVAVCIDGSLLDNAVSKDIPILNDRFVHPDSGEVEVDGSMYIFLLYGSHAFFHKGCRKIRFPEMNRTQLAAAKCCE